MLLGSERSAVDERIARTEVSDGSRVEPATWRTPHAYCTTSQSASSLARRLTTRHCSRFAAVRQPAAAVRQYLLHAGTAGAQQQTPLPVSIVDLYSTYSQKPPMRCVRQWNEKRTVFWSRRRLSKERVTDLAGSLVTSCRPPGRLQQRPDDRTWNAGVAVRTADGSRWTADAGDEQCLRCGCRSPSCTVVRCYLPPGRCWRRAVSEVWMQQSVMYCAALCCRRRWTVAHSLYCTG